MRPVVRNALSVPRPTGNGYFPPLDADTTQLMLRRLVVGGGDYDMSLICMIKCVSSCVANACRRFLCEEYFDLSQVIQMADVALPVRAFLSPMMEEGDWPEDNVPSPTVIVHALTMEAWYDGLRVTNMEAFKFIRRFAYHHLNEDVAQDIVEEFHVEFKKWEFTLPTFVVEYPGVGIFHNAGLFTNFIKDRHGCNYNDTFYSTRKLAFNHNNCILNIMMDLHPFVQRSKKFWWFFAHLGMEQTLTWSTSLALLSVSGRLV